MSNLYPGVTFYEDDRFHGPFKIRIGGTREFISHIDTKDSSCWPPGSVKTCEGWDNAEALIFDSLDAALEAAGNVWDIEGFHTSIERVD
tara:strand:+ start:1163 stop:1429 length:267 start_codon:yes stop_codon:yes gene_type:complete